MMNFYIFVFQKTIRKAEAEYVAAKMELHSKQEMKEQLTEHLYTIIHQNEVRKAKKLAELMKTLEMEAGGEEEINLPELPPLTSFQPTNVLLSPTGSKHLHHDQHSLEHTKQQAAENSRDAVQQSDSKSSENSSSNTDTTPDTGVTQSAQQNVDKINSSEENSTSGSCKNPVNSSTSCVQTAPTTNCTEPVKESNLDHDAVDLSVVKTEPAETESNPEENSKLNVKTAWDFDGTVT